MKFKFGISEKLILTVIGLITTLIIIAGFYSLASQRKILLSEFDEKARILVSSLAAGSEYPVLTGNDKLLNTVGNAVLKQKDVIFCEIKDKDGKVLFEGGSKGKKDTRGYAAPIVTEKIAETPDEMIFAVSQEKKIENIGEVYLTFSLYPLMERMNKQKNAVIFLITVGIMVMFLFITLLVKFILGRHINELIKGTRKIAAGDLNYKVSIKSKDEVGLLASSFNKMTEDLQKTTVSRDELSKEVSERKKAEEELKRAYDELKATQAQLVQSAKMASIGQLAGGVAHEINNPLTGVLNNVQLIRMEQKEKGELNADEFKELLGVIEESALRCKKITQSLLDFSYASKRIFQPVSLNELVEKVLGLIGYEIKRQNIVVQKQFQPDLPKVSGDSQLLQQVIFDIVSNAKWAIQQKSGKEGGTITIKTEYEPKSKQVCIWISDTGIGIPQENLQRIFEPFFTTRAVGEGTGLGLSIVYNIVKEHKGTIEVESKVNEGSTFRINLPL